MWRARWELKAVDLWIGAFWKTERDNAGRLVAVDCWLCAVPCVPLHVSWRRGAGEPPPRICICCGCSDFDPCLVHGLPCCWPSETDDTCSSCLGVDEVLATPDGRAWLRRLLRRIEQRGLVRPWFQASGATDHDITEALGEREDEREF